MRRRGLDLRDALFVAGVAALYVAAALAARRLDVFAISDDDFARAVIAEQFARTPRLDPSGTSWLPAPFWVNGATMAVFGRSFSVARAVALALAGASGALVVAGARKAGLGRLGASVAAAAPLAIPLVPALAATAVPELPSAALAAFAVLAVASDALVSAGVAILVASLARYDAWPIAVFVAVVAAASARDPSRRRSGAAGASLAVAGPLLWVVWNGVVHRDALSFAHRVAAYRAALGAVASLASYPVALVRFAPVHVLLGLVAVFLLRDRQARLAVAGAAALVIGLLVAEARGGAPTHHPERALVAAWLVLSVVAVRGFAAFRTKAPRFVAVAGVFAAVLAIAAATLSPAEGFLHAADRAAEIADGEALRTLVPPGEKVLLVPRSYAYFALVAAFGRPEDAVVVTLRTIDPRSNRDDDPSRSADTLAAELRGSGARFALVDTAVAGPSLEGVAKLRTGQLLRAR